MVKSCDLGDRTHNGCCNVLAIKGVEDNRLSLVRLLWRFVAQKHGDQNDLVYGQLSAIDFLYLLRKGKA